MKKTRQSKIDANIRWAKDNIDRVTEYKTKYKNKQKRLAKDYINNIKSRGCKICGTKNIHCLDFHHRPEHTKKDTVCNLVRQGYSFNTIKKEIEKCDIICSNCHRSKHYTGNYMRNKKGIKVHEIKSNSKCKHCGYTKVECLDFHHLLDKKDSIGSMTRDKKINMEQLEAEISKCIILCSNCHRTLHANGTGKEH